MSAKVPIAICQPSQTSSYQQCRKSIYFLTDKSYAHASYVTSNFGYDTCSTTPIKSSLPVNIQSDNEHK